MRTRLESEVWALDNCAGAAVRGCLLEASFSGMAAIIRY
jgi:hypothetical protein